MAKSSDTGFIKLDESIAKGPSRNQPNLNTHRKLFKRGQLDTFEFEDQDIRTLSAIILSKDVKGENVLYIDYIQLDLHRSTETQSYRFPFDGWLSSAKQDQKSEQLKAKFGLRNSIITYPNEKPKYEYTIKVSPAITRNIEYKIEIDYDIKTLDRLIDYKVEFLSELPSHNGRLTLTLIGSLGKSQSHSFTQKSKSIDPNNKLMFKLVNKDIGDVRYVTLNYDDGSKKREHYLKGLKVSDDENGLNYS